MPDQPETFWVCKVTIPLLILQILDLYVVPTRFYESLNEQNRMCELCTFPKSGHKFAILPELVGKWFTKQPVLPLKTNSNEDTSSNLTPVRCYCRRDEEFDTIIGCDNEQCTIQWYHLSCLQIPQNHVPKGKWYCPDCHKERSKVKKK